MLGYRCYKMMAIKLWHFPFTEQDELFFPDKLFFKIICPVTKGPWSSCYRGLCDYWVTEQWAWSIFFLTCFVTSFVPTSLKIEMMSRFIFLGNRNENRMMSKFIFLGVVKNRSFIYWMLLKYLIVKWCQIRYTGRVM